MYRIILDTDIGCDMDDMLALAYLLARDDAELLGITTVTGEPVVRARLADMMCRLAGKDIPVHSGADQPLRGQFRQRNVIAKEKALLEHFPNRETFPDNTAVGFLRETVERYPGEITICAIGPLTNIALLFTRYPHIPALLRTLVIMGGRFGEADTVRWGAQEWNILNDPAAAKIVFRAPAADVRVFGVEQTCKVFRNDTEALSERCEVIPCLLPFSAAIRTNREAWYHDAVAVSSLFCDDGMTFTRGRIGVSDAGDTGFTPDDNGPHLLLTDLDKDRFFAHYYQTIGIPRFK